MTSSVRKILAHEKIMELCQVIAYRSLELFSEFHHTWASPSSWNAASQILVVSEVISIASNTFSKLHEPMVCHHRISSPCEYWRMICPEPLKVPQTSLTTCKTRENSNFLKNGKIIILIKTQNFCRSQMTKWISPLESSCEI